MAKHVFLVLSNPTEGKEDEYNDWYDNIHLGEVIQVPGFTAAQRFKLDGEPTRGEAGHKYMAIYEMDTDDPQGSIAALGSAIEAGKIQMSDAIDGPTISATVFTPHGGRKTN